MVAQRIDQLALEIADLSALYDESVALGAAAAAWLQTYGGY
jgi:hypothetical protein